MFRRENWKCFGETKNCFGVNHQAGKVSERVRNFLEGARNVLGPSGIFPERTRAKNTMFPQGGQDSPFRGELFFGWGSLWGAAPFWWKLVGGAPMVGGSPHKWWRDVGRGAPYMGRLGQPSPFSGLMFVGGPPFWAAILHAFLHPSSTINRGGEVLSISSQVLTQMACNDLPLSLSPSMK